MSLDAEAGAELEVMRDPVSWPDSAPLLTDDHAPVEWLTDLAVWSAL